MNSKDINILLIVMDTVRADHLSSYGYSRQTTPNIDELCTSSIVFKQCIAPSVWSHPSHASLFTGLFPSEHGVFYTTQFVKDEIPLLAEVLSKCGYSTVGFTGNPWISSAFNFHRGFDHFFEFFRSNGFPAAYINKWKTLLFLNDHGTTHINKNFRNYIKSVKQPFFVFVNYMEAHQPYLPRRPFHRKFGYNKLIIKDLLKNRKLYGNWGKVFSGELEVREEDIQVCLSLYDRQIAYLDYRIGELISFLVDEHILDNTLIIITSDHGENFGEHDFHHGKLVGHHFCLYDTLLWVPLIIRFPGIFKEGVEISSQVQLTDIFPTILSIINQETIYTSNLNSKNLLSKEGIDLNRSAFAEYKTPPSYINSIQKHSPKYDFSGFDIDIKMVRTPNFKLICSNNGNLELYNLEDDPYEQKNILELESAISAKLKDTLTEWYSGLKKDEAIELQENIDKQLENKLRLLGYL